MTDHVATHDDTPGERQTEQSILKVATISLIGTSIEWYDFFLYGVAAAIVFPQVFFAGDLPPLVALFAAFATFAVGFVARPVGGVIFGHFGDKLGRKGTLVTALVMMGSATALIGLLPTYAAAGAWAPAMLIVLRFVQGLAIGGQWGGAMLLATESAPPHRRGFYGSFAGGNAAICCGPYQELSYAPCPPNSCPLKSSASATASASELPATPFVAAIVGGRCVCVPPQECSS